MGFTPRSNHPAINDFHAPRVVGPLSLAGPTRRTRPLVGKKVDLIDWHTAEIERREKAIEEAMHEDQPPLSSAVVTFNSAVATLSCESTVPWMTELGGGGGGRCRGIGWALVVVVWSCGCGRWS